MNFDFEKMLSTLKETLSSKTVVGEPLEFGDVKLIPVISVYYGSGRQRQRRPDKGLAGGRRRARIHVWHDRHCGDDAPGHHKDVLSKG